jgi:hypothetical protein
LELLAWSSKAPKEAKEKKFALGICGNFEAPSFEVRKGAKAIFLRSTSNFRCQKLEAKCKKLCLACLGTFELQAWKLVEGPNTMFLCFASNFWCQKLEAK